MSSNTLLHRSTGADYPDLISRMSLSKQSWLNLLTWIIISIIFIAGIWMRLHLLDIPIARDSSDEGVYWQSLRAMYTGASLYQQIFDSQPPFFLLSIYPIYALLGQTIWSARLGIAIISLCGLLGALLLGKALAGRLGMIMALLLLVANPLYLTESQTLQADVPATALALLAVALAYLWWKRPDGPVGYCLAMLTGITLALSLLTKLLALPALAPISLLALARLWQANFCNILCVYMPNPNWVSGFCFNYHFNAIAVLPRISTILANSCHFPYGCQGSILFKCTRKKQSIH